MSQEIRAIYENGLFRPLDPVSVAEHDVVSLMIGPADAKSLADAEELARQKQALREVLDEADRLPLESPDDGFSGAGVANSPRSDDDVLMRQREALVEMFAEADSLPLENPDDTFSGADHDLVLYGWKK